MRDRNDFTRVADCTAAKLHGTGMEGIRARCRYREASSGAAEVTGTRWRYQPETCGGDACAGKEQASMVMVYIDILSIKGEVTSNVTELSNREQGRGAKGRHNVDALHCQGQTWQEVELSLQAIADRVFKFFFDDIIAANIEHIVDIKGRHSHWLCLL